MSDETTTNSTTEPTTTVDPNIQTQEGVPTTTTAQAGTEAGPTAEVSANGNPAGTASPAVANPANHATLNDNKQTMQERQAEARSEAMTNHAAEQAVNGTGTGENATEETVA
jgi:hypothetical protein